MYFVSVDSTPHYYNLVTSLPVQNITRNSSIIEQQWYFSGLIKNGQTGEVAIYKPEIYRMK